MAVTARTDAAGEDVGVVVVDSEAAEAAAGYLIPSSIRRVDAVPAKAKPGRDLAMSNPLNRATLLGRSHPARRVLKLRSLPNLHPPLKSMTF
jgi:hypothetical protein